MATLRATVLQNFATIGIPDYEEGETVSRSWSIVGLSENLIDEERLTGIRHLNARRLDLVIHNGSKFALLNLQAFKIFECEVASNKMKQCIAHHLTPDGKLLFGLESSGNVIVLMEGLQKVKRIRKPAFLKIHNKQPRWYEEIAGKIYSYFTGGNSSSSSSSTSPSKINQVSPEATLQSIQIDGSNEFPLASPSVAWWKSTAISSFSLLGLTDNLKTQFPYLTSLVNGLALLCAFSPTDCYIFLTNYDTALRVKSVANIKSSQVPGRWYRVIMHKSFVVKWLRDRRTRPCFEARLCYTSEEDTGNPVVGGAMQYGVMENLRLEVVYGVIKKSTDKFTLSWETLQFDVDWAVRETDGMPYSLGARFVTKLSSDCTKIVVVISNHLGVYIHVQEIPFYSDQPIQLKRQRVSLCNHSDYDGFHFYKQACWVSDVQWLVEDAYFAVITLCGSLAIFHHSGEPMIIKVRKAGPEPDEDKSARFYFPVFHPHQIATGEKHHQRNNGQPGYTTSSSTPQRFPTAPVYPTLKWVESEQVLTCSSGMKMELFSIQRVIPISLNREQSEIWLGEMLQTDVAGEENDQTEVSEGFVVRSTENDEEEYETASESNYDLEPRPATPTPVRNLLPSLKVLIKARGKCDGGSPVGRDSREDEMCFDNEGNEYFLPRNNLEEDDERHSVNNVEIPSHIEELPPDGGEVVEEQVENVHIDVIPTPEKLRQEMTRVTECLDETNDNFLPGNSSGINDVPPIWSPSESLAEVVAYNQEYSDGSSQPDSDVDYELAVGPSMTPLEEIGDNFVDNEEDTQSLPYSKPSQQYLADDEADEEVDVLRVIRKSLQWKSPGRVTTSPCLSQTSLRTRLTTTPEEESDHHPRSSTAYSQETYSSPFSYAPTTAENINDASDDDPDNPSDLPIVGVEKPQKTSTIATTSLQQVVPPVATASTSHSSIVTTLSLRMPPVPKISGVVIPSERQSAVLLQNIGPPYSSMTQPELLRYKPPPTNTVGEIGTGLTGFSRSARRSPPPLPPDSEGENGEEEENDDVTTLASIFHRSFNSNNNKNSSNRQP